MARQDPRQILSKRLTQRMNKLGITKAELARRSGLPWLTVQRIEKASTDPHLSTIESLAAALDVPLAALLGWF